MDIKRKKIVINLGIFGTHGIDRAAVNFINQIPLDQFDVVIHQIYERDEVTFLAKELPEAVTIVTALPRTSFWGNIHMNRYKGVFFKLLDSVGIFAMQAAIAKSINALNADAIYDYDISLQKAVQYIHAPVIGFIHFSPKRIRGGDPKRLSRMGRRLKMYKYVVLLCNEMKSEALELWPAAKEKFKVIPNPINDELLIENSKALVPSEIYPKLQAGYIVNVARLTGQKDHATLLKAYKIALELGVRWPLVIVGDGDLNKQLKLLATELNIVDQVLFTGHLNNPAPWMKYASLFALSSNDEGFGIALVEAMILGCPAVSTSCPVGPSDILKNGQYGLLSPVGNPEELAKNIFKLYSNKNIYDEFKSRLKMASEPYLANKVSKDLLELIN